MDIKQKNSKPLHLWKLNQNIWGQIFLVTNLNNQYIVKNVLHFLFFCQFFFFISSQKHHAAIFA